MNTRKIILGALAALLVLGIGNFALNAIQTRSQLALIASTDPARQDEGVKSLMGRGVLFDALQGGAKPEVRMAAIDSLTRLAEGGKDDKAFDQLLQMLKDPDTESAEKKTHPVRDKAKDAVAKVGIAYPDKLLDACKNPDKNIQEQSRAALKQIGAPLKEKMATKLDDGGLRAPMGDILSSIKPESDVIPLITPYLTPEKLDKFKEKPDDLANAKIQLIEILGKFKVPEAATPILPFKDDENPNVRRAVITALANIGDPVGAPVLIGSLNNLDTDPTARAASAVALGAIATPEANEAMLKALSDFDSAVAIAAAAGLRRAGDRAYPYVERALNSPDVAVRELAAEAAGGMRQPTLAVRAMADKEPSVRAEGAESLGDILVRANGVRADITRLAAATDPADQEKAYRSLQTRGALSELDGGYNPGVNPAAKANAISMLKAKAAAEADEKKRKPFEDAVKKLETPFVVNGPVAPAPLPDGTSAATITPLVKALRDKGGNVAGISSTALGRMGRLVVPSLLPLLSDPDDTVAYLASESLVAISRPAVDDLLTLAQDGKAGARWAAVTLGEIGDPKAAPALEALSKSSDPDVAYAASGALAKVRAI